MYTLLRLTSSPNPIYPGNKQRATFKRGPLGKSARSFHSKHNGYADQLYNQDWEIKELST
ncbi:hypothetical protein PtA15_16A367 [Puccinia triticina]|uniref:Uncharacterized protein n=1 Tax=Puccinia triticina TaxID=208348 RepID=A0ABY7D499_9BASI|nr:uncharacterized protein PtA15_16A367 [Puccinia triticina]WAQ92459.1 hypothetical protein PtA15_16A367 [Puccinia triticina]